VIERDEDQNGQQKNRSGSGTQDIPRPLFFDAGWFQMSTPLVVKISTIRMKPPTSTTKLQERPWQIDATNTSLSDTSYVWAIPYGMLYKVKPTIAFLKKIG
jgi:hypothetical protein